MSYDIWQFLGKPDLVPSKLTFQKFLGTQTASLGKICVKICIQDQSMHIPFHVANKDQAFVNVVLGRQWIGMTNCQINWTTREYLLKVNSTNLT